jgi:pimeloyl-ACP methyl ester carboxylesterase
MLITINPVEGTFMYEGQENGIGFRAGRWPLDKDKSTLLFIHGAGGSKVLWQTQVESLAGRFNTVALDLPGHGSSSGAGLETINDYARVVFSFIEGIKAPEIIPCGLSMGGAITQQLLLDYPGFFRAGILINTGARLKVLPFIFEAIETNYQGFVALTPQVAASPKTDTVLLKPYLEAAARCRPEVARGDFLACHTFNASDRLNTITVPVLIVTSADDQLTPPKLGQFLAEQILGAHRYHILEAGHLAPIEKPEEVNRAITEFLDRLSL